MQRIRSHRVNSLPVFLNQNNCHARRSIISRWGMCDGGSEVEDSPWELEKIDINTLATFVSLIPCQHFEGFPDNSVGKESVCNAGDSGLIPGLGRSGEGKGYPLQYSGLANSMDCIVHGVTKSWT